MVNNIINFKQIRKHSLVLHYSLCKLKCQSGKWCIKQSAGMLLWTWCSHSLPCLFFFPSFRTNTLKLEGVRKLWGKEGYLPKKESKAGKEDEPQTVSCSSLLARRVAETPVSKSDQVSSLSEEEKEKQQLASTLFVGLGSNANVSLVSSSVTCQLEVRI